MGFEPTNRGLQSAPGKPHPTANDALTANPETSAELAQKIDPELEQIALAWPTLPAVRKAGILARW